jgi:predicted secreted protein
LPRSGSGRRRQIAAVLIVVAIAAASFLFYSLAQGSQGPTPTSFSFTEHPKGNSTGFTPALISLSTSNVNTTLTMLAGEAVDIQLNSTASTGYDWNVSTSSGIAYQNYTVVVTSPLAGGPQTRNYQFQALEDGNQSIQLLYQRPFSPHDVQATISIQVTVMPAPLLVSYNFKVDSSGGSLFVVLKDDQPLNFTFTQVYLDKTLFAGNELSLGPTCGNFTAGVECGLTLTFGASQNNPFNGTSHWLELVSPISGEYAYKVTDGVQYVATCVQTSSC